MLDRIMAPGASPLTEESSYRISPTSELEVDFPPFRNGESYQNTLLSQSDQTFVKR